MSATYAETLASHLGFRILEATTETMSIFQNAKKEAGGHEMKCLPIINEKEKTITYPTFQKHMKFAVLASIAPKCETLTFRMLVGFAVQFYDIPGEFFKGQGVSPKCGLVVFPDTEYDATIRLWTSKQVGKSVIYELTVSSYKDAVPQPMGDKPFETKKVSVGDMFA